MKKNINLMNGCDYCWKSVNELTDDEVATCLEAIKHMDRNADGVEAALYVAEGAATDRDYVQIFADAMGELVIG